MSVERPSNQSRTSKVYRRTCSYCRSPLSGRLFALLLRRLIEERQQRSRVDVAPVESTLERKQMFAVVLLERETGAARRAYVERTADVTPFLALCHLLFAAEYFKRKGKGTTYVHLIWRLFMNHRLRSAQVWHVFSRDLTVLPAHPYVYPQSE